MADTIYDADEDYANTSEDSGPKKDGVPENLGTIDSVDGRPALPFSVAALAVSFVLLYFTPLLELALGFGNPSAVVDPGMKLLVAFFLAFGVGIFWEYIF